MKSTVACWNVFPYCKPGSRPSVTWAFEESVADCANALSEVEQKRGRERKHHQKEVEIHQPRVKKAQRDKPKGRGL